MSDEYSQTLDKHTATVADAISLLKRTLSKVAMSTRYQTAIIVPREALPKIAKAINPSGQLYPDPIGDFIHFHGVSIISKESGEAGIHAALEKTANRITRS